MKWNNTQKDELPYNGQEVLISVKGIYYIAKFNARPLTFTVTDEDHTTFSIGTDLIYWTHLTDFSQD